MSPAPKAGSERGTMRAEDGGLMGLMVARIEGEGR